MPCSISYLVICRLFVLIKAIWNSQYAWYAHLSAVICGKYHFLQGKKQRPESLVLKKIQMLPFSCLLASACEKYRKITPGTVQKNWGISLFILTGLSIFSCHFLGFKYIYTQFTFSLVFCWSSRSCKSSLGHPYSPWMLSQFVVPEHQVWHSAAQMSEERSHSLAPSTPQPQSWGRMFTWDFWCFKSKVMTCNSKPPAREWLWYIVFMMSGKILF